VLDTFKTKLASQGQKIEDWVDFPVEPRTWRKLRCTGTQDFCVKDKDGKETFSSLPGVFEVYVLEESGSVVILAFRAPLSLEPEIGLEGMARAVANSVGKK
jgi:hypothetical protein